MTSILATILFDIRARTFFFAQPSPLVYFFIYLPSFTLSSPSEVLLCDLAKVVATPHDTSTALRITFHLDCVQCKRFANFFFLLVVRMSHSYEPTRKTTPYHAKPAQTASIRAAPPTTMRDAEREHVSKFFTTIKQTLNITPKL